MKPRTASAIGLVAAGGTLAALATPVSAADYTSGSSYVSSTSYRATSGQITNPVAGYHNWTRVDSQGVTRRVR